jgi:hypothetical protein
MFWMLEKTYFAHGFSFSRSKGETMLGFGIYE